MNMKLYEITGMLVDFWEAAETGDIPPEAYADTLEGLEGLLQDKVAGIACIIKNLNVDIDGIKAEETRLKERRAAKENQRAKLKAYLLDSLQAAGIPKVETPQAVVRVQNNAPSVKILDVAAVLQNPIYLKPRKMDEDDISKTAVREALQAGIEVPGAEMQQTQSVRIK